MTLNTEENDIVYQCGILLMALPLIEIKGTIEWTISDERKCYRSFYISDIFIDPQLMNDKERVIISTMHHSLLKKITVCYSDCFWHNQEEYVNEFSSLSEPLRYLLKKNKENCKIKYALILSL